MAGNEKLAACGYECGDWQCREGGYLWYAGDGEGYDPEDCTYLCPHCRTKDYLEAAKEDAESTSSYSNNGSSGTGLDIWKSAERTALAANEPEALKVLAEIGTVAALDDEETVMCNVQQGSAAQPMAVEGMPERRSVANPETILIWHRDREWNACHDAFTAWLSKAAQGLPERDESFGTAENDGYANGYRHGWNAYADAVQPLVAQLRAEIATMTKYRDNAANHMSRIRSEATAFQKERDALRAEVEQCHESLKAMTAAYGINCNEVGTLRTANAELVGLLRRIIPSLNAVHDFDLISEIYALLASAGGGDAQ